MVFVQTFTLSPSMQRKLNRMWKVLYVKKSSSQPNFMFELQDTSNVAELSCSFMMKRPGPLWIHTYYITHNEMYSTVLGRWNYWQTSKVGATSSWCQEQAVQATTCNRSCMHQLWSQQCVQKHSRENTIYGCEWMWEYHWKGYQCMQ